jgi:hypothetical protein
MGGSMIKHISHERLLELVHYDPETGLMKWLKPTSNRVRVGQRAGSLSGTGYLQIKLDGTVYSFHCIAWFYVTGVWPDRWIDHKDGDKANNRFLNFRLSTVSQNAGNARRSAANTSGFKGVHKKRGKWAAEIFCSGRKSRLGVFTSPEEAHAAYCAAAKNLFGEFARAA